MRKNIAKHPASGPANSGESIRLTGRTVRNVFPANPVRQAPPVGVRWVVALLALFLAPADYAAPQRPEDPLASSIEFLPVDEAFVLSARRTDRQLVMRWDMPDGYYLYRHAFAVEGDGPAPRMGDPVIPAGKRKVDEYFGESEVYYGQVEVTVPIHSSGMRSPRVQVTYQGCADDGLCYPPQRRLIAPAPDGSLEIATLPANAKSDVR